MVKNSFVIPIYIILFFILSFIVLTTLNLLAEITLNHPASFSPDNQFVISNLPKCMFQVFPFALIISTSLLFFRELVKPGNHLFSFLLIFITLFCFLFFGTKLISFLPKQTPKSKNIEYYLSERKITTLNDFSIYVDKIEGNRLYNLFLFSSSLQPPHLNFYNEALTTINKNELKFSLLRNKKENLSTKATSIGYSFFSLSDDFRYFIDSFLFFSSYLEKEIKKFDLYSILFTLSLAFYLTGTGLFMRITRWPMFNFILYFSLIIFMFPGFHFFSIQIIPEIENLIPNSNSQRLLPIILIGAIGIIFNIIDFLFIPYDRWKKDLTHG